MNYCVILIENFKVKRSWFFTNPVSALNHLHHLLMAFQEVNEVSATIVKTSDDSVVSPESTILNQIIVD